MTSPASESTWGLCPTCRWRASCGMDPELRDFREQAFEAGRCPQFRPGKLSRAERSKQACKKEAWA